MLLHQSLQPVGSDLSAALHAVRLNSEALQCRSDGSMDVGDLLQRWSAAFYGGRLCFAVAHLLLGAVFSTEDFDAQLGLAAPAWAEGSAENSRRLTGLAALRLLRW